VTAWTGSEALFLGGDVGDFCPPNAGCSGPPESAADGAAYYPAQQTWRAVAEAPQPIEGGTPRTVAGDTVHLVQDDRLLSYDASEDAWSVSPPAPAGQVVGNPAALDDGTVVVIDGEREAGEPADLVYDPASRTWSELPEDPFGPSFDRFVTAIPGALVLTARSLPVDPEGSGLEAAVMDLDSDTWDRLGKNDRSGGWRWSWTGERMVDVYPDGVDGEGQRFAQAGALDPRTGEWTALPGTPAMNTGGWPVDAVGGPVAAVDGWVYDDRDRSWTLLSRPDGAPGQPGSAVWAGDELLVLGGMDTDSGWDPEHLSTDAWVWRPAAVAETVAPLTGRRWVLESPEAPGIASLDFRADGAVDVATGCVEGTSRWHVTGEVVSIEEFGWFGLACSEAEFDRQGPLFDTWSSFRPTVEGDVLTLVPTSAGAPTLVYRAT
jgi:hypothetical protein